MFKLFDSKTSHWRWGPLKLQAIKECSWENIPNSSDLKFAQLTVTVVDDECEFFGFLWIVGADALGRQASKRSGRCKEDKELAAGKTWLDSGYMHANFGDDPSSAGIHWWLEISVM